MRLGTLILAIAVGFGLAVAAPSAFADRKQSASHGHAKHFKAQRHVNRSAHRLRGHNNKLNKHHVRKFKSSQKFRHNDRRRASGHHKTSRKFRQHRGDRTFRHADRQKAAHHRRGGNNLKAGHNRGGHKFKGGHHRGGHHFKGGHNKRDHHFRRGHNKGKHHFKGGHRKGKHHFKGHGRFKGGHHFKGGHKRHFRFKHRHYRGHRHFRGHHHSRFSFFFGYPYYYGYPRYSYYYGPTYRYLGTYGGYAVPRYYRYSYYRPYYGYYGSGYGYATTYNASGYTDDGYASGSDYVNPDAYAAETMDRQYPVRGIDGYPVAADYFAEGPTPIPEGCGRVHKVGRDHQGRKAVIGGTLCYDKEGRGFIVEGSRYIVEYY